jgi:hypothetical protein
MIATKSSNINNKLQQPIQILKQTTRLKKLLMIGICLTIKEQNKINKNYSKINNGDEGLLD